MCWMCEREAAISRLFNDPNNFTSFHVTSAAGGALGNLGLGEVNLTTGLIVIGDDIPANTGTTATLTVNGAFAVSTIETIGDQDFFRVELVAGQTYEIGMNAKYGGPNGIPLSDALFEIYDATGNLVTSADGGGQTIHNTFFTGFDALLTFTPSVSGTYFINARAFDDGVTDDANGNYVGDYELFVRTASTGGFPPSPPTPSLFPTTIDDVPNDLSTNRTLDANDDSIVSTIDAPNDRDVFRIELVAGKTYEITQYAATGGPSGTPLADNFFQLFDATGRLVAQGDAGGDMPGGLVTTDVNAKIRFEASVSGTYYLSAGSGNYTNIDGGTAGDLVGDYKLSIESWQSFYSSDSPLSAIDWGTQVDRTSRNPDGAEGPRPTGNAFTGVGWNPYGIEGKNVITYYFAKAGEVFIDEDPTTVGTTDTMVAKGFEQWEKDAYLDAFGAYSSVADIVYVEVDDKTDADFILITYAGTTGTSVTVPGVVSQGTPSLLGRMSPPGEENEGRTEFNANDKRWTPEGLQPGGFSFTTLVHEMGHGHGLAHPHDPGGRSTVMRGVVAEGTAFDYTRGDFDLNQGIHTVMSYEDGWETSPYGQAASTDPFGWPGSLMAFDIAAIQDKYGVNEEWATGNDSYILKDVNAPGTFYSCIWDAAGTDEIVYDGARDANIDLRAATLKYEPGGGGWVSYAWGIFGGFTIANGVTIENARTGSGNDALTGNDAANRLDAGAGNDVLIGGGGDDILVGGAGKDSLAGGAGRDLFLFQAGDSAVGLDRDVIAGFEQGSDRIDLTALGATTFIGSFVFSGQAGQVRAISFSGATIIEVDQNGDGLADLQLELADTLQLRFDDFVGVTQAGGASDGNDVLTGTALSDVLNGMGGNDALNGLAGNDRLIGGTGADQLTGGLGSDVFAYESTSDSPLGGCDTITDFTRLADRIDLAAIDANSATAADDAFRFIGKNAFSGAAGELRAVVGTTGTAIMGDINGDRVADFQIMLDDKITLASSDFML